MNTRCSIGSASLSPGRPAPSWRTLLVFLLLAPALLPAQTQTRVPAAPAGAAGKQDELTPEVKKRGEIYTLNPLEVVAEKDDGFMATNAGTATKLGLDMKDLAAPYSVMTGEFIQALGITNLEQAAIWATNGAPVLDGQGADMWVGVGGARTNLTNSMYFARGVILNAGQQRNFFLNSGTNDAYNIERIDFGRGPNAVLFNVGANNALGGGISTIGKRARTDRDFNTLRLTVGSWDYYRSTLDVNQALSDKLAVRGNFLYQERGGWQDGERDDRTGATLAGTWRIANRSELNLEVRKDKFERSRPPVPFGDNLSAWNGSTVFNGPISNYQYDGKVALAGTDQILQQLPNGTSGQGRFEGIWRMGDTYIYDPASGTVMNWLHLGSTRRGDENEWTPIYFNGQPWSRNGNVNILPIGNYGATGGNSRTPSATANGGSAAFTDMISLPDERFSRQLAGSRLSIPGPRDSLLPDEPLYREDTEGINLNFSHKFADNLVLEAQVDYNSVELNTVGPSTVLSLRNLFIDLNRNLPNGQPNPNYLDAYAQAVLDRGYRTVENAGVRAALAYMKDFGKWGHYTFNLSAMATARDVQYRRSFYSLGLSADPRDWHSYAMNVRYYQHGTERPFLNAAPTTLFDRVAVNQSGADNTYTTSSRALAPGWALIDWQDREERNQSAIFAFVGRWFDNKLVVSPGVRVSRQNNYIRSRPESWGYLPADPNWDGVTLTDAYYRPDAPADWKTLTYIPRDANGKPMSRNPVLATSRPQSATLAGTRDVRPASPLYANDRFRNDYNAPESDIKDVNTTVGLAYHVFDWMALKLSYGTSFLPAEPARFTLDGADAKSETGIAYDVALTFGLFDNKLTITPRYYFNRSQNRLTGSPAGGAIDALMNSRAWDDIYPSSRNPFDLPGTQGSDYVANYNDGYELEIAGKVVRGWRLSASLGTAQVREYERWPLTRAYVESRKDEFRQVLEAAGGMIDTSQKPMNGSRSVDEAPGLAIANPAVTDAMIQSVVLVDGSTGKPSVRTNAVNAYNNIWAAYDRVLTQTESTDLKRLSAKLVTDYTIQEGRFKGFRFGLAAYYVDQDRAGYRSGDTIANPDYNPSLPISTTNRPWIDDPSVDGTDIIWVKRPFQLDALFGYTRRIRGWGMLDGTEVELQLNIRNVLNGDDIYYQDDGVVLRPPNGDVNAPNRVAVPGRIAQYQRPINYEFTTTLKF